MRPLVAFSKITASTYESAIATTSVLTNVSPIGPLPPFTRNATTSVHTARCHNSTLTDSDCIMKMANQAIRVVNDPREWARLQEAATGNGFFAFYSSATQAVTTRPELMSVIIHDHAIVRGHAVFDTCTLVDGRLYRLGIHLDRFFASARAAKLPLPFGHDEESNRARITEAVRATCVASGKREANVRFWLTAGTGNVGVTPEGCTPQLYVLVFEGGFPEPESWSVDGIPEASVPESLVPLKPPLLAELKSNNYMLNALTMMAAQERGGTFGIAVDSSGQITESCVNNVVVVGKDRVMRTPPFDGILRGTTARRCMELARQHLVRNDDQSDDEEPLLAAVNQEPVALEAALAAAEVILVGGDMHVLACVSLDGHPIGDGKPGPVSRALRDLLEADAAQCSDDNHQPL